MKRKGYYSQSDLYCSTVYGSGIYEWSGQYVQDPLCGDNGEGHISPLLTNIITGEQFFVKRFNCSDKMYPCYRERILTPPVNDYILWPSDMIDLTDEQQTDCSLFVAQEYTPTPTPNEERKGANAFLFPYHPWYASNDAQRTAKCRGAETSSCSQPARSQDNNRYLYLGFDSANRCQQGVRAWTDDHKNAARFFSI